MWVDLYNLIDGIVSIGYHSNQHTSVFGKLIVSNVANDGSS